MPTMRPDPVSMVEAAVHRSFAQVGPGLIGLACSGGADSMVLADAARAVCGVSSVILLHVDHGLQAGSADVGTALVAWARGQGIAAVVRRVEVTARASLEAAARTARYEALDALGDELGLSSIWLAHTARDQAETVLMRVVRGTGPAGLAGIPARRGRYVRPLLDVPREVIDAYAAARGLPVWDDPMNHDERIARVRFRERHLPALRAENPAIDEALLRLAASAREWREALESLALPHARFPIDCAALRTLPAAVRKLAYSMALSATGYDAEHLDAIDDLALREPAGERRLDLPGLQLVKSYDTLTLAGSPRQEAEVAVPAGHELRTWRPGDRMKPARLKGRSRKLSDLYIDLKVPRSDRANARVLVRRSDQEIVWAELIGWAFNEGFRDI